jgi:hypothetical protein
MPESTSEATHLTARRLKMRLLSMTLNVLDRVFLIALSICEYGYALLFDFSALNKRSKFCGAIDLQV